MFVLVRHHVAFKVRVFHLWQANFASYEELAGFPVRGLFIFLGYFQWDITLIFTLDGTTTNCMMTLCLLSLS